MTFPNLFNPLSLLAMFRPSELFPFLDSMGKRPTRRLSQNFLIDGNIIRKIVDFAEIQPGDTVLEIGPGPGALTQILLEKGAQVIAIEKDRQFASTLSRLQTTPPRLQVIEGDFLTLDLTILFKKIPSLKVVANIPYNITTPILLSLIAHTSKISSITLMVQKEVASRLVAKTGTADYSSLTLLLQYYASIRLGFNIAPSCFFPPPSVRSAVVQLTPLLARSVAYPEHMIRSAFQQRRKMIRSSLKTLFPDIDIAACLKELKLNPDARPEELSLDHFIDLSSALTSCASSSK